MLQGNKITKKLKKEVKEAVEKQNADIAIVSERPFCYALYRQLDNGVWINHPNHRVYDTEEIANTALKDSNWNEGYQVLPLYVH